MKTKKSKNQEKIEREILRKLFMERRNRIVHSKKASNQDIKEIRDIIRKLRKLRGF